MGKKSRLVFIFLISFHFVFSQISFNTPENITLYWDTSLSLKAKDLSKELTLLDTYFANLQNVEVELIKFGIDSERPKDYSIVNGDWSILKKSLLNTVYDGVAFFDQLLTYRKSDINLLFTDGIETVDKLLVNTKKPTYLINSCTTANHKLLKKTGTLSQGNYIDLNRVTIDQSMALLNATVRNIAIQPTEYKNNNIKKKNIRVRGTIYGPDGVLQGATIKRNSSVNGVVSDEKGNYEILVDELDLLEVSYVGMQSQIIRVKESFKIDVNLFSKENILNEVVVKGQSAVDDENQNTGYGAKDKKKIGYAVQSIKDEDISEIITSSAQATQGRFSISNEGINNDISRSVLRGFISINFSSYPMILIDNVPVKRTDNQTPLREDFYSELTTLVDPNNIADVTVLKGLAATNIYGSEGSGGVILITTKTATFSSKRNNNDLSKRKNYYSEEVDDFSESLDSKYLNNLRSTKSAEEAYQVYLKERERYYNELNYFADASDYFYTIGEKEKGSRIVSNIIELKIDNIDLLRLTAFKLEKNYEFYLAQKIYEQIVSLRPNEAQSHRDLALIYQETGKYIEAQEIYNKMINNEIVGVDFSGVRKSIVSEYKRLVMLHKDKLSIDKIPAFYLNALDYNARVVFNWSTIDSQFNIQFVNPKKLFFNWPHTNAESAVRINDEKRQGYNSEEFLITGDDVKGDWLINLENKTRKKTKEPQLLKYTVYLNYGKSNEIKKVKTILLDNVEGKQTIDKIVVR